MCAPLRHGRGGAKVREQIRPVGVKDTPNTVQLLMTAFVRSCHSSSDFQQVVQSNKLVVVDFSAKWCGPCKRMAPLVEQLAERLADKVTFVHVDADELSDVADRFNVTSLPTFWFFKDGEQVDDLTVQGASVSTLKESLRQMLDDGTSGGGGSGATEL
jgi:thioredoxin 1